MEAIDRARVRIPLSPPGTLPATSHTIHPRAAQSLSVKNQFARLRARAATFALARHLVRHHVSEDVERGADVGMPHEFLPTAVVPTASSQLRYMRRSDWVGLPRPPMAGFLPCIPENAQGHQSCRLRLRLRPQPDHPLRFVHDRDYRDAFLCMSHVGAVPIGYFFGCLVINSNGPHSCTRRSGHCSPSKPLLVKQIAFCGKTRERPAVMRLLKSYVRWMSRFRAMAKGMYSAGWVKPL